jgi:DNA helicase-2/ATP-dependent DNA helicase PcrA
MNYEIGQKVRHKKFGSGVVSKVEKSGKDITLEINFDGVGMRRLLAAFANLEMVN